MSDVAFVEREFDNAGTPVVCRFFQPTLQPGGEYRCRWSISWGNEDSNRRSHGIDGIQALLLAMRSAHTDLVESEPFKHGKLTYLNGRELGLPPPFTLDARQFRWATAADFDVLADIMFDAVRNGDSLYSEQQRAAWVPEPRSGEAWIERLRGQDIILAEQDGRAVGFASLAEGGYVDFAYIRPEARHSGLFRQLLSRILERALARREPLLWTHASLMAEPAFAKLGFTIRKRERVRIGDQLFDRCEMEKPLATD